MDVNLTLPYPSTYRDVTRKRRLPYLPYLTLPNLLLSRMKQHHPFHLPGEAKKKWTFSFALQRSYKTRT